MNPSAHPELKAPWSIAEMLLGVVAAAFGAPADIEARGALKLDFGRELRHWLRAAEAFVRRLLLIEAASLDVAPSAPSAPARATFSPEVSPRPRRRGFRVFVVRRLRFREPCAGRIRREPKLFVPAAPLAARAAALIDVLARPAVWARRVARKLARRPYRARALARYPAHAPRFIGHDNFVVTEAPVEQALARYDSG